MQLSINNFKYAHTFAIMDAHCDTCNETTAHSFSIISNNSKFTKAKRVKVCETCLTRSEAPVEEGN